MYGVNYTNNGCYFLYMNSQLDPLYNTNPYIYDMICENRIICR